MIPIKSTIKPINDYALIALTDYESGLSTTSELYDKRESGILIALPDNSSNHINLTKESIGKTIYFTAMTGLDPITIDDIQYTLIPLKEIRGLLIEGEKRHA